MTGDRTGPGARGATLYAVGIALIVPGWALMWATSSYMNPAAFTLAWTGLALVMWAASGAYPGVRRHLALAAISVPAWWYFEAVNLRTANWSYLGREQYSGAEFAVLASLAFSTVVPAIAAASALLGRRAFPGGREQRPDHAHRSRLPAYLVAAGLAAEAATLAYPTVFYPLVWIAPFLVIDGIVLALGGPSLAADIRHGNWRRPATAGGAGLVCGAVWEFWNFWAFPKWVYDVPLLDFAPVFEMPLLGYGGYVPFAWSIVQAVTLADHLAGRLRGAAPGPLSRPAAAD